MLIITPILAAHLGPNEDQSLVGRNRFECRTCPYTKLLNDRYYDIKTFEAPATTEDVLGGAESWKNVDRTEGISSLLSVPLHILLVACADGVNSPMPQRQMRQQICLLQTGADSECGRADDEFLQVC